MTWEFLQGLLTWVFPGVFHRLLFGVFNVRFCLHFDYEIDWLSSSFPPSFYLTQIKPRFVKLLSQNADESTSWLRRGAHLFFSSYESLSVTKLQIYQSWNIASIHFVSICKTLFSHIQCKMVNAYHMRLVPPSIVRNSEIISLDMTENYRHSPLSFCLAFSKTNLDRLSRRQCSW